MPQVDPTSQWFEVTSLNRLPKGLIRSQQSALSRSIFSKRSKSPRVTKVNVCPTCYMVTEMVQKLRHWHPLDFRKAHYHKNNQAQWKLKMETTNEKFRCFAAKNVGPFHVQNVNLHPLNTQLLGHGNCITIQHSATFPHAFPARAVRPTRWIYVWRCDGAE